MPGPWKVYEELHRYPVDEPERVRLFAEALECSVVWVGDDGWPMGVVHWFVWDGGKFFVTSGAERPRVEALRARPESCVIVSSAGTGLGPAISVSARTRAAVRDDSATRDWFAGALAAKAYPDQAALRTQFERMLRETRRVVIELEPVRLVSYDGSKMAGAMHEAGLLGRD